MDAQLESAVVALGAAAAWYVVAELRFRAAKRERDRLALELRDVKRRVGADRRLRDRDTAGE